MAPPSQSNRGRSARFTGAETVHRVPEVEAFVVRAKPGDRFVYMEAAEPIRGETWTRVRELHAAGLVDPLTERRAGGGYCYLIQRTKRRIEGTRNPIEAVLADAATAAIFAAIKRAANFGLACPTDAELMRKAGLGSRDQAQWRVRKLTEAGLIASTLAYEGGVPKRVVTVVASGKRTALPPKWAALAAARGTDA